MVIKMATYCSTLSQREAGVGRAHRPPLILTSDGWFQEEKKAFG